MKKKIISSLIALSVVTTYAVQAKALEPSINTNDKKAEIVDKLSKLSGGKLKTDLHKSNEKDGKLHVFVSGKLSEKQNIDEKSALTFLEDNRALFGVKGDSNNFKVLSINKDDLGFTNVKATQLMNGIPVRGAEILVQFNKDGIVSNVSGSVANDIDSPKSLVNSTITDKQAIDIAKKQFKFNSLSKDPTVEKQVIVLDGKAYETYKVNIYYLDPEIANWDVFIDTNSGSVIDKQSKIRFDGAATGTGTAVDGSSKPLNLYLSGSSYQMIDTTKPMTGQIKTYTANNKQVEPGTLVANSSSTFNTTAFKASVSAHYFAGVVYDFYKNLLGRNSIDNNGMSIISTTHYDTAFNNAYWDGNQMVYGDGDGTTFTYLSGDLDVIGHELTHGVTQYTANLDYQDEPGALNESMSDVMGVLIETYDRYNVKGGGTWQFNSSDWVVGDDVYTPGTAGDALRSLANPTLYGQPANYSDYVHTTSDYGGVHTNSGITNKAAYLVAQALGCEKTSKIYYRGLTTYMTASTDFLGARNALVKAATDLYGASSAEVTAVNNAFTTVGIGATSVSDPYEPNDSTSQAYAITSGTTYSSYISTSTDKDYYKLSATAGKAISVSLTNLPKDYDLYLYNSSGTLVAKSVNGSTTSESISYTPSAAGTYYVLVFGYNSAYSTATKYNLKATF
ncbi:peptidase M4 [Clostridium zeae]|uniref:Neutral metalloproteinase n=1 Tax=Clostridium zeae TaxID=2759022 RepID=A0ABQ1EI74_9CLOT|nr:M4 family metallopeptidase [Clostridium zeae]GFZ34248.1 peptidase M4 [Clostridium zeae]